MKQRRRWILCGFTWPLDLLGSFSGSLLAAAFKEVMRSLPDQRDHDPSKKVTEKPKTSFVHHECIEKVINCKKEPIVLHGNLSILSHHHAHFLVLCRLLRQDFPKHVSFYCCYGDLWGWPRLLITGSISSSKLGFHTFSKGINGQKKKDFLLQSWTSKWLHFRPTVWFGTSTCWWFSFKVAAASTLPSGKKNHKASTLTVFRVHQFLWN